MGTNDAAIDTDVSKPMCNPISGAIKNYKWISFKDGAFICVYGTLLFTLVLSRVCELMAKSL